MTVLTDSTKGVTLVKGLIIEKCRLVIVRKLIIMTSIAVFLVKEQFIA